MPTASAACSASRSTPTSPATTSSTSTTRRRRPPSTTASAASRPPATSPSPAAKSCCSTSTRSRRRNEPQRRRHPLRPRRQALRRRRRERRRRPTRRRSTNLLGKMLRINADGTIPADNPFFTHRHRRQPGDLGARPAQPVHVRLPARHRPDLHQRRRPEHLGGDRRRHRGRQLRLARRPRGRPPIPRFTTRSTPTPRRRAAAPSPAGRSTTRRGRLSQRGTSATTSSPTSAPDWIRQARSRHGTASRRSRPASGPVDLKVGPDGALYYLSRRSAPRSTASASPANRRPHHAAARVRDAAGRRSRSRSRSLRSGSAPLHTSGCRNGIDIAGATSPSYTLHFRAQLSDNGAAFDVRRDQRARYRDEQRRDPDGHDQHGADGDVHPAGGRHDCMPAGRRSQFAGDRHRYARTARCRRARSRGGSICTTTRTLIRRYCPSQARNRARS